MRASRFRVLIPLLLVAAVVVLPAVAGAQTPAPGEEPEVAREWTWYLSLPVLLGSFGLAFLILFSYLRLSSRFYGREEAPRPRPQPQYAGVNAPAYPAPVQPQAATPAPQAPAAEPAQSAQATATAERPAPEKPPEEKPPEEKAEEAPAEEAPKPEEKPAEERPAEEPEKAEEAPAEEAPKPQEPEKAEPAAAAGSEDDVYERVLKEQLDKGVSPKVAEGRAKAAQVKAKRQQGGE